MLPGVHGAAKLFRRLKLTPSGIFLLASFKPISTPTTASMDQANGSGAAGHDIRSLLQKNEWQQLFGVSFCNFCPG